MSSCDSVQLEPDTSLTIDILSRNVNHILLIIFHMQVFLLPIRDLKGANIRKVQTGSFKQYILLCGENIRIRSRDGK